MPTARAVSGSAAGKSGTLMYMAATPQQAAKRTTDGRQPFVGQWGLLNSRCGKVADNGDAGDARNAKKMQNP